MFKKVLGLGLVLILFAAAVFAQGEEDSITITTYYPSPYGVYNELQSNRMSVGDTDGDNKLTAADQPNRDGDIRLRPQSGDPTNWPAGEIGQFAYSQVNDEFYHHNGSSWVPQAGGGGGGAFTISCGWITTGTPPAVGSCTPSDCPADWNSSAVGCRVLSLASTPPGCGGCTNCYRPRDWYEVRGGGYDFGSGGAAGECYRSCYQ